MASFDAYLTAYWNLNESSGDRADSVGSNDFIDMTSVGSRPGVNELGMSFMGQASEYLSAANSPDISPTNALALSIWVYFDQAVSNQDTLIIKETDSGGYPYQIWRNSSEKIVFTLTEQGGIGHDIESDDAVSEQQWYHIVAVAHDGNMHLYIDGVLQADTEAYGTPIKVTSNDLTMSTSTPSEYFDGAIDEIAFWKDIVFANDDEQNYFAYTLSAGVIYSGGAWT